MKDLSIFLFLISTQTLTGCEQVYYLLHKEGAQEKRRIGTSNPAEKNEKVLEIQRLLKLYGYPIGKVDGKIGPNTRQVIVQFQKDNGLELTRFVDNATWEKLNMFAGSGLIIDGEVNIGQVQMALKNAGFDTGPVDGQMGKRTKAMLASFQKRKGLKADGIIGFKTLRELAEYLPKRK